MNYKIQVSTDAAHDRALKAMTQEVTAQVSFRTARTIVETVAGHPWVSGWYFCPIDAEILEQAARNIRQKLKEAEKEKP